MSQQARTYPIFDYVSATGPEAQTSIHPQMTMNQFGLSQVTWGGAASEGFKLEIQGRLSTSHGWAVIETVDETDVDTNGEVLVPTRIMPHMRAELVSVTGAPSNSEILVTFMD